MQVVTNGGLTLEPIREQFLITGPAFLHIAFCYGLMAALQSTVVHLDGTKLAPILWVTLPLAGAAVYLFVAQSLKASRAGYKHARSTLLVAFGIVLVSR
jgi:hypothetical protein